MIGDTEFIIHAPTNDDAADLLFPIAPHLNHVALDSRMRPCNQCRHPVENSVVICHRCQQKNQKSGQRHSAEPPRTITETPDSEENARDYSFDLLVWIFVGITIALGALIGLATSHWTGFWTGSLLGLLLASFFIALSRRF